MDWFIRKFPDGVEKKEYTQRTCVKPQVLYNKITEFRGSGIDAQAVVWSLANPSWGVPLQKNIIFNMTTPSTSSPSAADEPPPYGESINVNKC
uniref:Uncharacterized protein n=1 Tax=Romanomermis culicivorax TaxID=13658 RepID=A0A915IIJ1_ROMCU